MKNKKFWFLIIALFLCSGVLLVNRFIIAIPDWIAVCVIALAAISLFIYYFLYFKYKNDKS